MISLTQNIVKVLPKASSVLELLRNHEHSGIFF